MFNFSFEVQQKVFWVLVVGFMLFGMVGCQTIKTQPKTKATVHPAAPASALPTARPVGRQQKPVEASKSRSEPRPSQFRRKLRAKYADSSIELGTQGECV